VLKISNLSFHLPEMKIYLFIIYLFTYSLFSTKKFRHISDSQKFKLGNFLFLPYHNATANNLSRH